MGAPGGAREGKMVKNDTKGKMAQAQAYENSAESWNFQEKNGSSKRDGRKRHDSLVLQFWL